MTPLRKTYENMIGIYSDEMISGHRRLVDAVHETGAKVAIQISHAGRRGRFEVTGEIPAAPSPIPCLGGEIPRELTIDEIQGLIKDYANAALRAKKSHFDAVMIHMANGYLIHQFLSPLSNMRRDLYGGDIEGRSRFAIEVLRKTKENVGAGFPITCRFCADEYMRGGLDLSKAEYIAKKLE